jgi:hypothetical protein
MLDVKLNAEEIKRFTLLNVNNRLGHDVRDKVMPVLTPPPHIPLLDASSLPTPCPAAGSNFAGPPLRPAGGQGAGEGCVVQDRCGQVDGAYFMHDRWV